MTENEKLEKYFLYSYYDDVYKFVGVFKKDIDKETKEIARRKYDIIEIE